MEDKYPKYLEIIEDAKSKTYMEDMEDYLSLLNFRYVEAATIVRLVPRIKELDNYQNFRYLIRLESFDKHTPAGDIFDYGMILAINIIDRKKKVHYWIKNLRQEPFKKEWKVPHHVNFKPKKKLTKYTDRMSIQDRIDFRKIEGKIERNKELTEEEGTFFAEYKEEVKEINKQ